MYEAKVESKRHDLSLRFGNNGVDLLCERCKVMFNVFPVTNLNVEATARNFDAERECIVEPPVPRLNERLRMLEEAMHMAGILPVGADWWKR